MLAVWLVLAVVVVAMNMELDSHRLRRWERRLWE
jgi:hypothetical protein